MNNAYGESWTMRDGTIFNADGAPIAEIWSVRNTQALRIIACVNACAGVAELGSVRELLIMLEKADEFIAAEGVPCYAPIRADIRNILARFRLEEDHD